MIITVNNKYVYILHMDINMFNQLNKEESAQYTWDNGTPVGFIEQDRYKIMLYKLPAFYVGVFYSGITNSIEKIQSFQALLLLTENGQKQICNDYMTKCLQEPHIQN